MDYEKEYNRLLKIHNDLLTAYKDYEQSGNETVNEVRALRMEKMSLEAEKESLRLENEVLKKPKDK